MKTILAVLLLLFVVPSSVGATVVLEVGLEEMTHASQVILHGKVSAVEVLERSGEPGAIYTEVTCRAGEVLKGSARVPSSGLLTISLVGGTLGGKTLKIPGMPVFSPGEEVVLFLEATATNYAICGLQQGLFRVDSTGSVKRVSRQLAGLGMARMGAGGRFELSEGAKNTEGHPLSALLKEVKFYVEQETVSVP